MGIRRSCERGESYVKRETCIGELAVNGEETRTKKPRKKKIVCKKKHRESDRSGKWREKAYEEAMEKVYKTRKGTIKV